MDKKREIRIPAAALLIILGVVLVIFKDAAPETVLRILAVGLMAVGAFGVYQQVRDKETKKTTRFGKGFLHVLLVILGVAILIKTVFFAAFVKYVFGGILIFFGVKDIIPAIRNKQGWLKIILSAVAIILGAFFIFFPPQSLTLFAGLALVYCGVVSFFGKSGKQKKGEGSAKG
jgi:uncharacterized membrane protein HdeD (DUF308 family)